MNDRERIAWLYRRVAFGLAPGQLDQLEAQGVDTVLETLLDPGAHGVAAAPDPWAGIDLSEGDPAKGRRRGPELIGAWVRAMATTPRPLEEWMRWFWHGHFVSTLPTVKVAQLMVDQLAMLARLGLGDFRTLVRAVTTDPAMLIYLDGVKNKKGAVNENYGRELLELFTLGIGNYTEADVRAGAEALTGWGIDRATGTARFLPRQHDDTPKIYLGRSGVHDVDTVVEAVVAHQACAGFIAGELSRAVLGPDVDAGLVDRFTNEFRDSGLQLRPLLRSILHAGLDGAGGDLISAPVPWFVAAIRATGAPVDRALQTAGPGLVPAGQVPMNAPNVAGWPGGRAWLSSSTTVARFNMAVAVSELAPADGAARRAARAGDTAALADELGRPGGLGAATRDALARVKGSDTAVLAVALASPELVLV